MKSLLLVVEIILLVNEFRERERERLLLSPFEPRGHDIIFFYYL